MTQPQNPWNNQKPGPDESSKLNRNPYNTPQFNYDEQQPPQSYFEPLYQHPDQYPQAGSPVDVTDELKPDKVPLWVWLVVGIAGIVIIGIGILTFTNKGNTQIAQGTGSPTVGNNPSNTQPVAANGVKPTSTARPPTATPAPTKPPIGAASIGVGRDTIKKAFEDQYGFVFNEGNSTNGQPTFIAQKSPWLVQLIGPQTNLSNASFVFLISSKDTAVTNTSLQYLQTFDKLAMPTWPEFDRWVSDNLAKAQTTGQALVSHDSISISLVGMKVADGTVYTLTVKKP